MNTLIAKLARASAKVGALKTDKTNTAQNYSYISADKILERAGDALAAEGIVVLPSITGESIQEVTYTDSYSKTKTRHDATVTFLMLITDGEGELKAEWTGRGSDFSVPDKALYKAITSGHKYFLTKLLNIGVGNEDGEHEAENEATAKPQARPQAQPATRAANAAQPPAFVASWANPDAAMQWSVEVKASENIHAARNAFKRLVAEKFDGKLTRENVATVYAAWHDDRMAKLSRGEVDPPADDAAAVQKKFDDPSPEARGAQPTNASKAMRARIQGHPA